MYVINKKIFNISVRYDTALGKRRDKVLLQICTKKQNYGKYMFLLIRRSLSLCQAESS